MSPDGKDECSSYESDWSTHETLEEAEKEYQYLLDCPQIYTASICGVIQSTDYDPLYNFREKSQLQTEAYINASGHFLTNHLPHDWEDMNEDDLNSFISDNLWEHFENCDPEYVWDHIDTLARNFIEFNKKTYT